MHPRGVALLIAALAAPASAAAEAGRLELFAGYGLARFGGDERALEPPRSFHGFEASAGWRLGSRVGLVADAAGHFGDLDGARLRRWSLLAGPRLSLRPASLALFVHALGGAVRTRESLTLVDLTLAESTTDPGAAFGGGIDLGRGRRLRLRVQGDLILVKTDDEIVRSPRLAAGVVVRLGR